MCQDRRLKFKPVFNYLQSKLGITREELERQKEHIKDIIRVRITRPCFRRKLRSKSTKKGMKRDHRRIKFSQVSSIQPSRTAIS